MRNNMMGYGLLCVLLFVMPSCLAEPSSETEEQALASEPVVEEELAEESSASRQAPEGELAEGERGLKQFVPTHLSCGLQGPWAGAGGWWKYGIYNCNPYWIRAQAFRINGTGGYCFTIAPYQVVYDWMQGNIVGIRGC